MKSRENFVQDASLKILIAGITPRWHPHHREACEYAVAVAHNLWEANQRYMDAVKNQRVKDDSPE